MKTLVVNCYQKQAEEKISRYIELAGRHSEPHELSWNACQPGDSLAGFSAVILSGSQWLLSQEPPPPTLAQFVRELRLPTLGICFGHQLLAFVHGARVLSGRLISRTEKIVTVEPHPLFFGLGSEFEMLESHREYVDCDEIRHAGWRVLAYSKSCPVEAICHPTRPLFGVQFHPERSGPTGEQLFQNFYDLVHHQTTQNGLQQLSHETHFSRRQ
ncbi:MAG: gamma-glutamyl-gamma-aminobutyrate hydrolase family protein [candidate division WOR-3 bacterium]